MNDQTNPHGSTLRTLLGDRGEARLYLCIRDLIENGLALDRFLPGERPPQRQDITQYLAAWSRHAGLSEEESRAWLVEYCATVLKPISRRTPAAIRHSTKSNLKYIYNSAVPFVCDCEDNRFKARCRSDCPVHAEMKEKQAIRARKALEPVPLVRYQPPAPVFVPPVKQVYREQFQAAMRLAREEEEKGTKRGRIVELLNERGFKTRTGRKWTHPILNSEFHKAPLPASPPATPPESNAPGT